MESAPFLPTWIIIVGILFFLTVIVLIFAYHGTKGWGEKAAKIIAEMDILYENFVQKRITYDILKNDNLDFQEKSISQEVLTVLKPHIEGLISCINASIYSSVEMNYQTRFLTGLPQLTEAMFKKKDNNSPKRLNVEDEKQIFASVETAIKSDLMKRILDLKTQNLL